MSSKTTNQNSIFIIDLKQDKDVVTCLNLETGKEFNRLICSNPNCNKRIPKIYVREGNLCADCQINKLQKEYNDQVKEADRYGL